MLAAEFASYDEEDDENLEVNPEIVTEDLPEEVETVEFAKIDAPEVVELD